MNKLSYCMKLTLASDNDNKCAQLLVFGLPKWRGRERKICIFFFAKEHFGYSGKLFILSQIMIRNWKNIFTNKYWLNAQALANNAALFYPHTNTHICFWLASNEYTYFDWIDSVISRTHSIDISSIKSRTLLLHWCTFHVFIGREIKIFLQVGF